MTTTTRPRWLAGPDRIAHAHTQLPRTLCGQQAIEERVAWPSLRRCLACQALVHEAEHGVTESENRMLWGDR